jgi:Glycosyl hydrolase family 45
MVKVCDKNNNVMDQNTGLYATSGCSSGGTAFMCPDFQPMPLEDTVSYGFAIQVGGQTTGDNPNCCKCHEVQWVSGKAEGKKMIVQILTPGGSGQGVKDNDLIILTPGGGVGPLNGGCKNQYGSNVIWYVAASRPNLCGASS